MNCAKDSLENCKLKLAPSLPGATTDVYCVLPRVNGARARCLRYRVHYRQEVSPDYNTQLCAMSTRAETCRSLPLVQSRHDRPSCQARNANASQMDTVIQTTKLDLKSGLVHFKMERRHNERGPRDGDAPDVDGFEVVRHEILDITAIVSALLAASVVGLFGWEITRPDTTHGHLYGAQHRFFTVHHSGGAESGVASLTTRCGAPVCRWRPRGFKGAIAV